MKLRWFLRGTGGKGGQLEKRKDYNQDVFLEKCSMSQIMLRSYALQQCAMQPCIVPNSIDFGSTKYGPSGA
jgi:hypothetical protein